MNGRILVTYASRTGTTAEAAEIVARTLSATGLGIDLRPMAEVSDPSPYRAVVAGSAIRGARWLPEAMEFVRTHRTALSRLPLAVFLVCITLTMRNSERYRLAVSGWLEPVRQLVTPVSEGLFPGRLDFDRLPLNRDTLGLRLATLLGIFPRGDRRDPAAVRDWAESLPPLLVR